MKMHLCNTFVLTLVQGDTEYLPRCSFAFQLDFHKENAMIFAQSKLSV